MDYQLDGLEILKQENPDGKYGYVKYISEKCEFSIASDSMGIQICYKGAFFGNVFPGYESIEQAVEWLRQDDNLAKAKEFFAAVKEKRSDIR